MGRAAKYTPELAEEFVSYIREGDNELTAAKKIDVGKSTVAKWKKDYPDFLESIKRARREISAKQVKDVEKSLYKRAVGYPYVEEKIVKKPFNKTDGEGNIIGTEERIVERTTQVKTVLPDVAAIIFFLTNRCPERWKNKQVQESKVDVSASGLKIEVMDDETAKSLAKIAKGDIGDEDDKGVQ